MQLNVTASGPAIAPGRLVDAVPILIERFRTITYDADGVAVIDGQRSDSVRLVDGAGGQPGATYELGEPGEKVLATVETDTVEQFGVRLRADADKQNLDGRITLDRPGFPEQLTMNGTATSTEKVPVIGERFDIDGVLRVAALVADTAQTGTDPAGHEPHGTITARTKVGRIDSTVRVRPVGDRWEVALTARIKPRGLMLLAVPAWPFVRGKVKTAVAKSITDTLTGWAKGLAAELGPDDGPQEVADRFWQQLVAGQ